MASKAIPLLAPVTLCFLLLVLGGQGMEATASSIAVIFHGAVRCNNNPSTIVSNASLQVEINNGITTVVVATGQTTGNGRFLIAVKVTSDEQLISLLNNSSIKVVSTNACGVSSSAANAVVDLDDTPIPLVGYQFLGAIRKTELLDFIHAIRRQQDISSSSGPSGGAADLGRQSTVADFTEVLDAAATIVIDISPIRDIVNEGLFMYVFSVA